MPLYSAKASNLVSVGPVFDVQLQPSPLAIAEMRKLNQPIPAPITVSALIDTGASRTVIKAGIPGQLNLHPVGVLYVNTPTSQRVQCFKYAITMVFPSTAGIQVPITFDAIMAEAPLQGQNIQCLIGRDFLKHGILIYSGPDDMFTFSL